MWSCSILLRARTTHGERFHNCSEIHPTFLAVERIHLWYSSGRCASEFCDGRLFAVQEIHSRLIMECSRMYNKITSDVYLNSSQRTVNELLIAGAMLIQSVIPALTMSTKGLRSIQELYGNTTL